MEQATDQDAANEYDKEVFASMPGFKYGSEEEQSNEIQRDMDPAEVKKRVARKLPVGPIIQCGLIKPQ